MSSKIQLDAHAQYAPVSGTIEEINENLSEQPGLLNKSAENEGEVKETIPSRPLIHENQVGFAKSKYQTQLR